MKEKEKLIGKNFADLEGSPIAKAIARGGLPSLNKLPDMTAEERANAEEEVKFRREFVGEAGEQLAKVRREISEIEALPEEEKVLSPTRMARLANLKKWEKDLLGEKITEEGLRAHTLFAAFVEEVRQSAPAEIGKYLTHAIAEKRIRALEKPDKQGNVLYFRGTGYEPVPDATGKITPATLALVTELRNKLNAFKTEGRNAYNAAVTAMKARATAGLVLLEVVPGAKGLVYCYLPKKEEAGRKTNESHLLVELNGREIKPVEAIGYFKSFFVELKEANRSILIRDLVEGRLTGPRIAENAVFQQTLSFLKVILAAKYAEREVAEKKPTPVKTETAPLSAEVTQTKAEPAPTADTTQAQTTTPEPAPKKKRATKAKKTEAAS